MIRLIAALALLLSASAKAEFVPVCDRSQEVQKILADNFGGRHCSWFSESDLGSIQYLQVAKYDQIQLRAGDFAGMSELNQILFTQINKLDIGPGVLQELPELDIVTFKEINTLNIRASQRASREGSEIDPGALSGLKELVLIRFANVPIRRIQRRVFADLPKLEDVLIDCPLLEEIEDDSFSSLPKIKRIVFGDMNTDPRLRTPVPLRRTKKAAFRGVPLIIGLPPDFDIGNTGDQWGGP